MEETKKSGLSTAGMVLGIISLCVSFIPILNYLSFIMGILAVIFGIIGIIKRAGKGCAIAGLVLGILALVITYNSFKAISDTVNTVSNELNNAINTNSSDSKNTENNEPIKISSKDTIKGKDVEISIESTKFSQKVEAPTKGMFSSHYQVDDSSNTYLYVILKCKNISSIDLAASSVADVTVKYNNDYTYSSFSAIPDKTMGFTYSDITNIKPLTTQKIYYLAEMPKSISKEKNTPVEINIKVDDKTYVYNYR